MKGKNLWGKVEKGLDVAKYIGILDTCTCSDPIIIDWKGDVCGHCQILEGIEALQELRDNGKSDIIERLAEFRVAAEADAGVSIMLVETNLALAMDDVCGALGLDKKGAFQVLGLDAYCYAYELFVFQHKGDGNGPVPS